METQNIEELREGFMEEGHLESSPPSICGLSECGTYSSSALVLIEMFPQVAIWRAVAMGAKLSVITSVGCWMELLNQVVIVIEVKYK